MPAYREDALQRSVNSYLNYWPNVLWCHVANERSTSPKHGASLKAKGVKAGVPDVLIFEPRGGYNGLMVELKTDAPTGFKKDGSPRAYKKAKLSTAQALWLERLTERGYKTAIAYSLQDFINVFTEYIDS